MTIDIGPFINHMTIILACGVLLLCGICIFSWLMYRYERVKQAPVQEVNYRPVNVFDIQRIGMINNIMLLQTNQPVTEPIFHLLPRVISHDKIIITEGINDMAKPVYEMLIHKACFLYDFNTSDRPYEERLATFRESCNEYDTWLVRSEPLQIEAINLYIHAKAGEHGITDYEFLLCGAPVDYAKLFPE